MKLRLIPAAFCILSLMLSANADVFILKDGTRLEGKLLREDDEAYYVEVQVTRSIRDERTVLKSDVKSIEKVQADEKAFESVAALIPTPDMLSPQEYTQRITSAEGFLQQYPNSSKAEEARKILDTLKGEVAEISAGGAKLDGKMIPAKEYRANAYDLDAQIIETRIRSLGERSDYAGALKAYGQLQTEYQNSTAYDNVRPYVKQILQAYQVQVGNLLKNFDARMTERKSGLARLGGADRANSERALAEEEAQINRRYEEEKAAKQFWITPHPMHKRSLEDAQRAANQELSRIDNPRRVSNVNASEAYRAAWKAIEEKAGEREVKSALANARASRMPARYIETLEKAAQQAGIQP